MIVGELYLDRLYKLPLRKPAAREISRFQPVRRDFSLVLDKNIAWEQIDRALAGLRIPELVDWRVREVFRDAKLGEHEYSLLMGATFQAPDRTLREEELQSFQAQVVEAVGKAGARLRARESKNRVDTALYLLRISHVLRGGFSHVRNHSGRLGSGRAAAVAESKPEVQSEAQHAGTGRDPGALTVSADDFSALEERIVRAVDMVKRERQARAAAEERAAHAEAATARAQRRASSSWKRNCARSQGERDQVRQRVERLLTQLDALEL